MGLQITFVPENVLDVFLWFPHVVLPVVPFFSTLLNLFSPRPQGWIRIQTSFLEVWVTPIGMVRCLSFGPRRLQPGHSLPQKPGL